MADEVRLDAIGMHTHDGYAPHSHEVRSDHLGVYREHTTRLSGIADCQRERNDQAMTHDYPVDLMHGEPAKQSYAQLRRCDNCGGREKPDNLVRTHVIDWRTDILCDSCVNSFDWTEWEDVGNRTFVRT